MKALRTIAALLCILTGLTVLTASTSRRAMRWITQQRSAASTAVWWGERPWGTGDLLRMGYLEGMAQFRDTINNAYARPPAGQGHIDLYAYGDSYIKDIPDSVFYGLHQYRFARRNYGDLAYRLDHSRINILIIEFGERFIRDNLNHATYFYEHVYPDTAKPSAYKLPSLQMRKHLTYAGMMPLRVQDLFNPAINQNIEYNLFSYNFITPLRAFKAQMNAGLFRRGSGDVVISDKGDRLFLKSTLAPQGVESAVADVPEAEIANMVQQLNLAYDHYRQAGFDEVYITIIPNPVSLLQADHYNHMLPRLQAYARTGLLRMPLIDVYESLRATGMPGDYYLRGDTHWNERGTQRWIDKVNGLLRNWEADSSTARRP